jgi:hypothetical protein
VNKSKKPIVPLLVSGALSATLYVLLFLYADPIMATFTRTDGFYWLLPVVMAFVFSLAHGAFTNYFWEVLGIRGRKSNGRKH